MTCRSSFADWRFQLSVWGYTDSGARDVAAMAAEDRVRATGWMPCVWDEPERLTDSWLSDPENGWRRVPDRFALPWVTEHLIRQEVAA